VAERIVPDRGLIDTSIVIALEALSSDALSGEVAIAAITLAELAAGPHATEDLAERGRRQERLQRVEATFDPVPFDADCARAYGRVYAQTLAGGRRARGRRAVDLLIAATALAVDLALFAANPGDFSGLEGLIDVAPVIVADGL
jgi:predicted nucleic acid-binding protein